MNYRAALANVDYHLGGAYDEIIETLATALTDLERLQERDTAKKVVCIDVKSLMTRIVCPVCNEALASCKIDQVTEYRKANGRHCPNCGQRLDWSE